MALEEPTAPLPPPSSNQSARGHFISMDGLRSSLTAVLYPHPLSASARRTWPVATEHVWLREANRRSHGNEVRGHVHTNSSTIRSFWGR